jgi:hypothetical protein
MENLVKVINYTCVVHVNLLILQFTCIMYVTNERVSQFISVRSAYSILEPDWS